MFIVGPGSGVDLVCQMQQDGDLENAYMGECKKDRSIQGVFSILGSVL